MESQRHMPAIFTALGHPEWMEDERFNTLMARLKNRHVLTGLMAEILLGKTLEEWVPIFAEHDVWHEKVQRTVTAVEDPQLIARLIKEAKDPRGRAMGERSDTS